MNQPILCINVENEFMKVSVGIWRPCEKEKTVFVATAPSHHTSACRSPLHTHDRKYSSCVILRYSWVPVTVPEVFLELRPCKLPVFYRYLSSVLPVFFSDPVREFYLKNPGAPDPTKNTTYRLRISRLIRPWIYSNRVKNAELFRSVVDLHCQAITY